MGKLMISLRMWALLIFLGVSLLIVSTWFRGGFIYGGAEIGLFTFNPEISFEMSRYVWWDAVAPGQLIPQFVSAAPTYFFFYILKLVGLSPQNIQQLFFTVVLFLMGFGVYLLFFDISDETRKKYAFVAGIFYMFNAYTLVQVWHRFLYSTMLLAAVLPFIILFWRRWIKEGKILHLTIFLLVNFLAVYMYGNLAAVVTVWITLVLVSLAEAVFPWQGKINLGKIVYRFLTGYIFWILTNIWWILPAFSIAPGLLSQQHRSEDNLATLVVISRQTIMPYLLQLVNPFYLFLNSELGTIYSNTVFRIIPWIMSGLIFLGIFVSLKIKNYARYGVIFMIGILLAKGAAIPFSFPYIFAFQHSYFLGILRNPFEKLGIMLPLFGAILFALGIQSFFIWAARRLGDIAAKLAVILIFIALLGYAWPIWGGNVFGTKKWPVKVKVPETYIEANEWLRQQYESQGVILHLPFSGKDVVTYNWPEGYHGVDQNEIIFTTLPSLSRIVGVKRIDDTLSTLTNIFDYPFLKDKNQILRTLQAFNVRFIVLHEDTRWEDKDTYGDRGDLLDPKRIKNVLDSLSFLKKERQLGPLVIYKLTDENFKPMLTLTNNVQIVYPGRSDIMQILAKSQNKGDIITPIIDQPEKVILQKARQILIFPDKRIDYFESSPSAMIGQANNLYSGLLQMKNYFFALGNLQSEEIANGLISQTEKVFKISSPDDLTEYEQSMEQIFESYSQDLNIHRLFGKLISDTLRLHLAVLDQIGQRTDFSKVIEDKMVELELIPENKMYGEVFRFNIPQEGNYELLPALAKQSEIKFEEKGTYEINNSQDSLKQDLALRLKGIAGSSIAGRLVSFSRISPVSYTGKISLEKPTLLNFTQGYHPDWRLTLTQGDQKYEVKDHMLSNLYGNTWLINQIGDYDFKIEFTPQQYVEKGIIISVAAGVAIIVLNIFSFAILLKKKNH